MKERGDLRLEAAKKKEKEYREKVEREKKEEEEERLADFDRWVKEMEDGEDNE